MPDDVRVVEAMPPLTRAALFFRNLGLQHGKEIRLGWPGGLPGALGEQGESGPYVDILSVTSADADFLILHRVLLREIEDYWAFVYDSAWAGVENARDAGFMERHRSTFIHTQPHLKAEFAAARAALLRERLGPAYYKDDQVLVWKLSE